MDTLKLIYKILAYLREQESNLLFDEEHFTASYFGVTDVEFSKAIYKLIQERYITGIKADYTKTGLYIALINPAITIKGLEYLEENSTMKKIHNLLKGIKEVTPFV